MKQRILSCFLVVCIIAAFVPAFGIKADAVPQENQALYTINQETDGTTDNVIVAEYGNVSYVMGAISADGKAAAIPAEKRSSYGNDILIDETTAELFKVEWERISYSNGSYPVYRMITQNGYIVDSYGNDYEEHKLAAMDKETVDASDTKPYYNWRFDWAPGWYNNNTAYRIYLVIDQDDRYFELCSDAQAVDDTHIRTDIFHRGCQHPNMEYVPAVPPTCKQDGHDEYWYCPDCDAANMGAYFSDADGLNSLFNPPIIMSYGAIDDDHDGVCDDCGKNMPVFRQVTNDSQIVAGGKYILVSKVADKYYAAATGSDEYGTELPAIEITPAADGTFSFESAADAMMIELQFAHNCTEWGNGIRYGVVTKFNGKRSELAPEWGGSFGFYEYDIRGAKYGFYVGLNSDGTARIHSAYNEAEYIRSYTKDASQLYTLVDYSENASYAENTMIFLYRLTDTGTVGTNTYDMTAVKSVTDYTVYDANGTDAAGGTNITGITDALTQTAVDAIVQTFAEDESITGGVNIQINASVNVTVKDYTPGNSITFSLMPTAVVSGGGAERAYDISDLDFDGTTPMTVILYTGGISPAQIIHEKQDGTNEYFYPEYSEKVMSYGEKPFYKLYDNNGNMYVSFQVTEFSDIRLLTVPIPETVAVTGVTIDETLSVNIGETKTPVWTVTPAGATNRNVIFTIDDSSVATVNESTGEVTGVKKGTAALTVKTEDGNFTDTCTVTVSCAHADKTDVPEKASSCLNQGWDAYKKCADCGQLFKSDGTTEIGEIPLRSLSTEHTGGTATCTKKAVCDVCGQPYGDFAAHNYSSAAKKAETLKTAGNCRDKAIYYYSCSACGAVENNDSHTFEGDKNADNHVGGTATVGASKPDNKTQTPGYTGDTKCLGCGEIIATGTAIPVDEHTPETGSDDLAPKMIEGNGTKVTSGGNVALAFRSDAAFSDFIRVEIDGKTLDAKHYTVKEGSTIVTLNGSYVSTLSVGEHTIGIVSVNGTATAAFAVEAKQQTTVPANSNSGAQSPQTGDNSRMAFGIALLFVFGAGVTGTAICGRMKKHSEK